MAIFIDPPLWPAHGTYFSHLVSDTSLAELHAFAAAADIPRRAFDLDHYDVPQRSHGRLVAAGAQAVDGHRLVRILIASGLRVPARERRNHLALPLLERWNALLPGARALGAELVERWGEPHRRYHDRRHLLAVLEALDVLAASDGAPVPRPVRLAAWFHDAVYRAGTAGTAAGRGISDEEASAVLARTRLPEAGLPPAEIDEVVRLVRLTAGHDPAPGDRSGALLCDADLSVLGRDPKHYARYLSEVRAEYAHVPDPDFAAGRAAVVQSLLALEPLFRTSAARRLWLDNARRNLSAELEGSLR